MHLEDSVSGDGCCQCRSVDVSASKLKDCMRQFTLSRKLHVSLDFSLINWTAATPDDRQVLAKYEYLLTFTASVNWIFLRYITSVLFIWSSFITYMWNVCNNFGGNCCEASTPIFVGRHYYTSWNQKVRVKDQNLGADHHSGNVILYEFYIL